MSQPCQISNYTQLHIPHLKMLLQTSNTPKNTTEAQEPRKNRHAIQKRSSGRFESCWAVLDPHSHSSPNCPPALPSARFHFLASPYCVPVGVRMFPCLTEALSHPSALMQIYSRRLHPANVSLCPPPGINLLLRACLPSLSSSSSSVAAFICLVPTSRGRKSASRRRADALSGGAAAGGR